MTDRTTYHRNAGKMHTRPDYQPQVLAYVREHPDCTAVEIADALGIGVQTVRNHVNFLHSSGHIERTYHREVKTGWYTFRAVGDEAIITIQGRNRVTDRTTPAKHRRGRYNTYQRIGGTLDERINAIVERDRLARLAPQQ